MNHIKPVKLPPLPDHFNRSEYIDMMTGMIGLCVAIPVKKAERAVACVAIPVQCHHPKIETNERMVNSGQRKEK